MREIGGKYVQKTSRWSFFLAFGNLTLLIHINDSIYIYMYIHKLNGFFPKFWREMDELQRRQFLRSERFSDLLRAHRFEALQFGVAKVDAAVGGVGGCPFAGPGAWK